MLELLLVLQPQLKLLVKMGFMEVLAEFLPQPQLSKKLFKKLLKKLKKKKLFKQLQEAPWLLPHAW